MIYLDSSALMKLIVPEPETPALLRYIDARPSKVKGSSLLAVTEVRRGLSRLDVNDEVRQHGEKLIAELVILPVSRPVIDHASRLPGRHLRTLDALHLASAHRLRSALTVLITYDARMIAAAAEVGIPAEAPL